MYFRDRLSAVPQEISQGRVLAHVRLGSPSMTPACPDAARQTFRSLRPRPS